MFRHIHKHIALYSLIGLVTLIAACSGSSSGGGDGGGGQTPLATGTFIKTAYESDTTGSFPFNFNTDTSYRVMNLYDVKENSGYIKAIAFRAYITTASPTSCSDITIKMGHTSVTSLSATFAENIEQGKGTLETVLNRAQVVIPPVNAGDYFTIQLDKAFYYNGADNLVVDFIRSGPCNQELRVKVKTPITGTWWDPDYFMVYSSDLALAAGTRIEDVGVSMKFTFAGGDDIIFYANYPDWSSCPLGTDVLCNKVQLLYDASEIDGSGPITGIAMYNYNLTTTQEYTMTVRLGHSTKKDLTTTFADNFSDTPVTVADGVAFKVPAGIPVGKPIWFPLNGSTFMYNGTDSLIVEIEVTDTSSATGGTSWGMTNSAGHNVRLVGDRGASTGSVGPLGYWIKFRFNGGTMGVITPETHNSTSPYGTFDHVLQVLYGAHDLGTKAQIDKVAFRLSGSSVATDYPGFSVVLGHTTRTALSPTLADNLDDPTTVFSGTMSIPGGLKPGDWVEIPVSGFTYDPGKNLTIQITTDAGANDNAISAGALGISGAAFSSIGSPTADLGMIAESPDLRLSYTKY